MKPLNPNKYKLISEADTHYEMLHPEGGSFKVAKGPLDESTHAFIKGLPLAHGGKVPYYADGTPDEPVADPTAQIPDPSEAIDYSKLASEAPPKEVPHDFLSPEADHSVVFKAIKKTLADPKLPFGEAYDQVKAQMTPEKPVEEPAKKELAAPTGLKSNEVAPEPPAVTTPAQQPTEAPAKSGPGLEDITKTYNEAIKAQGAAQAEYQDTYDELQRNLALQQLQQQKYAQEMDQRYNAALQDMQQNPIKAHSVWDSPNVGNKILAAIAVTLGGIGSGVTGQPNSALGVINKAMEMDLEAQKHNAANKMNLMRLGLDKFKDLHSAQLDASNYQLKAAQLYLDRIAQQTQNPLVKMQILKDTQALQNQYMMNNWELAKRQTSLAAAAGQTTDNPMLLPEGTAVRLPSANGKVAYIPARDKAAADQLSNHLADTQTLRGILDKMDNRLEQEYGKVNPNDTKLAPSKYLKSFLGTDYSKDAKTFSGQFKGQLRSVLAKGRMPPESIEATIEAMTPNINEMRIDQVKRHINHTREFLDELDRNAIQSATPLRVPK